MEQKHIFSVEVEDKPMVLVRIASLFSRRGFNIDSLTVGNTNKKGISRFTIVIYGDNKTLEQVRKQTQKIIHVLTTSELRIEDSVVREFAILKLDYNEKNAAKINHTVDFYGARMLDFSEDVLMVEVSGSTEKICFCSIYSLVNFTDIAFSTAGLSAILSIHFSTLGYFSKEVS